MMPLNVAPLLVLLLLWPAMAHSAEDAHQRRIVIDGEFEDWRGIAPIIIDPADAPEAAVDFREVRVHHDERFVYLLIDFGRTVNAQGLDGTAMILFDGDGTAQTGREEHGLPGVDVIVDLTPPNPLDPATPGRGMGLRSTTYQPDPNDPQAQRLTVYDVDLHYAPTHASRRFEFRLKRGVELPQTPVLFRGTRFSTKIVFIDLNGAVADETETFTVDLALAAPHVALGQEHDPLARGEGVHLRVMSWNIERGALFTNPQPFLRTLRAVQPDVVLLQEMPETRRPADIGRLLSEALPLPEGSRWHVLMGAGGGDLRCAVASRFPLKPFEPLRLIQMPHWPDRSVRAAGAIIDVNGAAILAVSVHLKCCGRQGSLEDEQRLLEVVAIHEVIRAGRAPLGAVIIGGDFNLVGSRDPIEVMAAGLDLDDSALRIAPALQIDGLTNATWSDPRQPFAPGRLDFLIYSDSTLLERRSFVFDSRHLAERWRERHGVQYNDAEASDHMPVVVDLSRR